MYVYQSPKMDKINMDHKHTNNIFKKHNLSLCVEKKKSPITSKFPIGEFITNYFHLFCVLGIGD